MSARIGLRAVAGCITNGALDIYRRRKALYVAKVSRKTKTKKKTLVEQYMDAVNKNLDEQEHDALIATLKAHVAGGGKLADDCPASIKAEVYGQSTESTGRPKKRKHRRG
jgi:hypothetical protein